MKPPGKTKRDTNQVGNISETRIIARLIRLGYAVFIPFGGGLRSDLIIEDSENTFWRVQCKSAWLLAGGTVLEFDTANHNVTGKHQHKRHYRDDCDFFALYSEELDKAYLVPVNDVGLVRAHLRLTLARRKNQFGTRMAVDYEL